MKFVKFAFIGLICISLAFVSLGFFHGEVKYENSIEIEASVEDSFRTFITDSLASEWLIGYVGHEVLSGAPHRPGSRFLMKFEQDGQAYEFIEELKAIRKNELFAFDMETDFFTGSVEIIFEGDENRTTITAYSSLEGNNIIYKSFLYLLKSSLQVQSQMNYDLLKEVIENNN